MTFLSSTTSAGNPDNFFDINLPEIVKTCYRKYIPMIVIASKTQESLEESLNYTHKQAVNRMKEHCCCITLQNTGRYQLITRERKEKTERLMGIGQ